MFLLSSLFLELNYLFNFITKKITMKNILFNQRNILFLLFVWMIFFSEWQAGAQISSSYEKGYVITKEGKKIQVAILDEDWPHTPKKIFYKYHDSIREAKPGHIKAIGIPGKWKYISATVDMDTVPDITERLARDRNPKWVRKTVFLKVLVDGKADLFMYSEPHLIRFFYRIDRQSIQPLVYRRYYIYDEQENSYGSIGVNKDFQQTLYNELNCPGFNKERFTELKYKAEDLKRIFIEYNRCTKQHYKRYHTYTSPDIFHLFGFFRGDVFHLQIINKLDNPINETYTYQGGGGVGMSFEYVLPFRHNSWGLYSDPGIRWAKMHFTYEKKNVISGDVEEYKWDYSNLSLDLPLSVRFYFLRRENWNMFAETGYVMNLRLGSELKQYVDGELKNTLNPQSKAFWQWGLGITIGRLNGILRYYTNSNMIKNYALYKAPYRAYALMLAYKIWEYKRWR